MWSLHTWLMLSGLAITVQGKVNMVKPHPVVIGQPMTVECSVTAVGGVHFLGGIVDNAIASLVLSYRNTKDKKFKEISTLSGHIPLHYINKPANFPEGVTDGDINPDGLLGPFKSFRNNALTAKITMHVAKVKRSHITEYKCDITYYIEKDLTRTDKKSFTQNVKNTKGNDAPFYEQQEFQAAIKIGGMLIVAVVIFAGYKCLMSKTKSSKQSSEESSDTVSQEYSLEASTDDDKQRSSKFSSRSFGKNIDQRSSRSVSTRDGRSSYRSTRSEKDQRSLSRTSRSARQQR